MLSLQWPSSVAFVDIDDEPGALHISVKLDTTKQERFICIAILSFLLWLGIRFSQYGLWPVALLLLPPILLVTYQICWGKSLYWAKLDVTPQCLSFRHNAGFLSRRLHSIPSTEISRLHYEEPNKAMHGGIYVTKQYGGIICVLPHVERGQAVQVLEQILLSFPEYGGRFNPFST